MNPKKVREKIKEKLRANKPEVYVSLVKEIHRRGAGKKNPVPTRELKSVHKNAGSYLKKLEKIKVVGSVKKGATPFLLDYAGITKKERFLHTAPEIVLAREKRTANLLNQVQGNPELLLFCMKMLNLRDNDTILEIMDKIRYSDDKDKEKINLGNHNLVVKELKKKKIKLIGFDEFEWMRGSYSWYITDLFLFECLEGGDKNGK